MDAIVLLCVLKGGFQFCQDLMTNLKDMNKSCGRSIQMCLDFMRLKSNEMNEELGQAKVYALFHKGLLLKTYFR